MKISCVFKLIKFFSRILQNKSQERYFYSIIVLDPPAVKTLSQQYQIEGRNLTVTCLATPGNPSPVTFYWTKEDNPGFRQNASILQLYNIQRNSSGSYRCTAETYYGNGQKGSTSQSMIVSVLCEFNVTRLYKIFYIQFNEMRRKI